MNKELWIKNNGCRKYCNHEDDIDFSFNEDYSEMRFACCECYDEDECRFDNECNCYQSRVKQGGQND